MKIGIYARVSTQEQQTLSMQIERLRRYAADRGWAIVLEIKDVGSGADGARPGRAQILAAAKRREIDSVVVWKLDRWGRSLADLVSTTGELAVLGVGFISLTEALDLTTPTGRALSGMLGVFAEFERDMLRERVKAGIAYARLHGGSHGRPRTAALRADEIRLLRHSGLNPSEISRRLGVSRTSVRRALASQSCQCGEG